MPRNALWSSRDFFQLRAFRFRRSAGTHQKKAQTRRLFCYYLEMRVLPQSLTLASLLAVALWLCPHSSLATPLDSLFLEAHCYDCHDSTTQKGDLNLEYLDFDPKDPANFRRWVKVHDKVRDGEMPPKKKDQPEPQEREAFLALLEKPLTEAKLAQQGEIGRSVVRRLNRVEFETALSDLFQMPLAIQSQLPEDAKGDGFDTVGAALNVSSVQMESYLQALEAAFDQATTLYEKPERRTFRLSYKDTNGMMQEYRRTNAFSVEEDGVAFLGPDFHSYLNSVLDHFTVPYSAKYRVRVSCYAIRSEEPVLFTVRMGGPGHSEREDVPKKILGHVAVQPGAPQVLQFETHLERGQFFRMFLPTMPVIRFDSPQLWGTQGDYTGPGVLVQWVEVDGPILEQWPPASHTLLWDDVPMEPIPDAKPNADPNEHLLHPPTNIAQPRMTRRDKADKESGNKMVYDPKQGVGGEPIYRRARFPDPLHSTLRLSPADPKEDAARLLQSFVRHASRRPVEPVDAEPFIRLAHYWLDQGADFEATMRTAYAAYLTSPAFLYHQASLPPVAGSSVALDPYELAERLAFFLWNGLPDAELHQLASNGTLAEPAVLKAQTERMLEDARAQRFLKNFLDQWLDLELLDFTTPDSALYPEHDSVLQSSIEAETIAFFNELLAHDLSVRNIIDSDFAMLDRRLAEHYGLPAVDDMTIRRVTLPPGSVRGGVLTQASVLKVTSNGSNTSPVVRGTWVLERILGTPPDPPPPGVPAIEPDIRGATTVLQQLEMHRSRESCAGCHAKIDPPGVALENFDVIGLWRDHYRVIDPDRANLKTIGRAGMEVPIKYTPGLPVDAADELPDGRSFQDIREYKELLLSDPDQIARTVVSKLITYTTGASVSFADRVEVERILSECQTSDHGLRSLVHAVIQSPTFHSK